MAGTAGPETFAPQFPSPERDLYSLVRADHLKTIARAAIPIRTRHAADDVKAFAPNPQRRRINQFVAYLHPLHQPDDQAISADLERAPLGAFETGRRLRDARRLDR